MSELQKALALVQAEIDQMNADRAKVAEAFEQLAHNFPQIQVDCHNVIEAAQAINAAYEQLRADKEKAEKACAAKDAALMACQNHIGIFSDAIPLLVMRALSSDCGQGYVSREELRPTIELLNDRARRAEVMGERGTASKLLIEAARLQKLMEDK